MNSWHILLVDDDADDRQIIADAIADVPDMAGAGMLHFAEDGEHALDVLETFHRKKQLPSIILLDLNMPKKGGSETLSQLKADERFCNIPVVIYSTSINPYEREKCMQLGAYSYIRKPISFKESIDIVNELLQICSTT